ncbi:unnamed protein product [Meganyctiphanes norvegica]|uniref:SET domain-containing protein n=1 Tax=Meganyctiphanes norvegica TaxID=48144 RepID=A0AAV2RG25_MEGNR
MEWLEEPRRGASDAEIEAYMRQECSTDTCVANKEGFFLKWQTQVGEHITSNFMNKFAKWTSDEDRIVDIWCIKPMHTLKIQPFFTAKNADKSVELRTKGNTLFQEKNEKRALIWYSQAISLAPHDVGDVLSVAYGNRSAVLFHMGEYRLCLEDIDLALESNYPRKLHFKVFDRRAQCYQKLRQFTAAQGAFQDALKALELSDIDAKKMKMWTNDINKRLEQCKGKEDNDSPVKEDSLSYRLFDGASATHPCASAALELRSSKEMGRYWVAGRDIPAGQVIFGETPLSAVLKEDKIGSHCSTCFKQVIAVVPCPTCCNVIFCSRACRNDALATFHPWECKHVAYLKAGGISHNAQIAMRMITERGPKFFKDREKCADYLKKLNLLVSLEEHRSPTDFFQRTLMACLLLKVLQRSHFFYKWTGDLEAEIQGEEDLTEVELRVGAILLKQLQVIQFNAHTIGALASIEGRELSLSNTRPVKIASGLYPTMSLLNHSCYGGCVRYYEGSKMVMITVRPVLKGEMICENYGPKFTKDEFTARQRKLYSRYWFRCGCEACTGRWPTYEHFEELSSQLKILCPKCLTIFPNVNLDVPMVKCTKCCGSSNLSLIMKNIKENESSFRQGMLLMEDWKNREKAISAFTEFVNLAARMVAPPYREMHLAQDHLRTLIFTRGKMHTLPNPKSK